MPTANELFDIDSWPRDPANNRFLCSPEQPKPENAPKDSRWAHTSVQAAGDDEDRGLGCTVARYECKDCGEKWRTELPQ